MGVTAAGLIADMTTTTRSEVLMSVMSETERLNDGLYRVVIRRWETRSQRQTLWTRAITRKEHFCWNCGQKHKPGAEMFRPMIDSDYRMRRLCETCLISVAEL